MDFQILEKVLHLQDAQLEQDARLLQVLDLVSVKVTLWQRHLRRSDVSRNVKET